MYIKNFNSIKPQPLPIKRWIFDCKIELTVEKMSYYEHTLIIKSDLPESQVKTVINKYEDIINKNSGKVLKTEQWGLKSFSYKIILILNGRVLYKINGSNYQISHILIKFVSSEKKLSYYINESKKLVESNFKKTTRIAVLGSFTLNGLADTIKVKCAELNIFSHIFSGEYNQYNKDILDSNSSLYSFSPEICFLILDTRNILENLFHSPYSVSDGDRKKFVEF